MPSLSPPATPSKDRGGGSEGAWLWVFGRVDEEADDCEDRECMLYFEYFVCFSPSLGEFRGERRLWTE